MLWLKNSDDAFCSVVRQEFGPLAGECGADLMQIEPLIFGFCTEHAVLTIGAYPGHFHGICVKVRRREAREEVSVRDGVDIGLANVEEFVTGRLSVVYRKRQRWEALEIEEEVAGLAAVVRQVALPFLTTPDGDWAGLRAFVDEKIQKAPKPGLAFMKGTPNKSSDSTPSAGTSAAEQPRVPPSAASHL
jgi:hypothetical protein